MTTIIGIDPGLQKTGWGVITSRSGALQFVDCGTIRPNTKAPLEERLGVLHEKLHDVINQHHPDEAAIEETFVSVNGASTLKLGQARGALLLSLSLAGLSVSEYAATYVKKTITGVGRAEKHQVAAMVQTLLPKARERLQTEGEDALDALAIAICHSHGSMMAAV